MAQETTPAETEPTEPAQGGDTGQDPDYKALYESALKESRKDPRSVDLSTMPPGLFLLSARPKTSSPQSTLCLARR